MQQNNQKNGLRWGESETTWSFLSFFQFDRGYTWFFYATKWHVLEKFLKKSSKLSVGLDGLRDFTVRPPDTSRKIESALQIPVGKYNPPSRYQSENRKYAKMSQEGAKMTPRWRQDDAKMSQDESRRRQDDAKMTSRWRQDGPGWAKMSQAGYLT